MKEYYQEFQALFGEHNYLEAVALIVIFLVAGLLVDWLISRGPLGEENGHRSR